jgi:hypothetical protein
VSPSAQICVHKICIQGILAQIVFGIISCGSLSAVKV